MKKAFQKKIENSTLKTNSNMLEKYCFSTISSDGKKQDLKVINSKYCGINISQLKICMETVCFSNMMIRDIFPQVQLWNLNCSSGMPSNILLLFKVGGAAIHRCRKGREKHIHK